MNIACFGDSWTAGYGVDKSVRWTSLINEANVKCVAKSGSTNSQILEQVAYTIEKFPTDLVIVGWSGVTRYLHNGKCVDFCHAENLKNRNIFFKDITMQYIQDTFIQQNAEVNRLCKNKKIKCLKFSVFNDFENLWDNNFLDYSFLNYLAEKQNNKFQYDIPFFEFDFLAEKNIKNTTRFAKKYFNKNWQRACVEREDIRPGKYFLDCGHPNEAGHKLWASYVKEKINDLF